MVFMMHALLDSSAAYVINGPGKSLGFIATDAGYDVRPHPPAMCLSHAFQACCTRASTRALHRWFTWCTPTQTQ